MTPREHGLNALFDFVTTGNRGGLTDEQIADFVDWNNGDSPLAKRPNDRGGSPGPVTPVAARELLTYYSRDRHNEWSTDWIRTHLTIPEDNRTFYPGFASDLVALCRSHHEGYEALRTPKFNSRRVSHGRTVHHRYLARVLRVADVLDEYPE